MPVPNSSCCEWSTTKCLVLKAKTSPPVPKAKRGFHNRGETLLGSDLSSEIYIIEALFLMLYILYISSNDRSRARHGNDTAWNSSGQESDICRISMCSQTSDLFQSKWASTSWWSLGILLTTNNRNHYIYPFPPKTNGVYLYEIILLFVCQLNLDIMNV